MRATTLVLLVAGCLASTACNNLYDDGDNLVRPTAFRPKQEVPTGNRPSGLSLADINDDGLPDLVSADSGDDTLSVLLNTSPIGSKTLSFAARITLPTGAGPKQLASLDLNADGREDLAVACEDADSISVFLNTTPRGAIAASFTARAVVSVADAPRALTSGDFNKDGSPDLAVANVTSGSLTVLVNTTVANVNSASFAAPVHLLTGAEPVGVAAGDLNGDGLTDLAVVNAGSDSLSIYINTTQTPSTVVSFAPKVDFATGRSPADVAIVDINRNGDPDVLVTSKDGHVLTFYLNGTLQGTAVPLFPKVFSLRGGFTPTAIGVGELIQKGQSDLVLLNLSSSELTVFINGSATASTSPGPTPFFSAFGGLRTSLSPQAIRIADLNGDGKPDLAVTGGAADSFALHLQR